MGFDDEVLWNACDTLQGIDVLRETLVEEGVGGEEPNEAVRWCRAKFPWVELVR
jgi:hypothetical protein